MTERRRVGVLERENRKLRTQLEALERFIDEQEGAATPSETGPGR
ncbi:MAG TPA: hypothetical protein VLP43_07090 [Solirubrobacteraceae bacterium]|nr:hypothetical protein [Solirubrobacteraceae bacterium]